MEDNGGAASSAPAKTPPASTPEEFRTQLSAMREEVCPLHILACLPACTLACKLQRTNHYANHPSQVELERAMRQQVEWKLAEEVEKRKLLEQATKTRLAKEIAAREELQKQV